MKSFSGFRFLIVFILLFLVSFQVFALSFDQDFRTLSMGGISVSGTGNEISYFSNPASIYFYNQKQKFIFQTSVFNNHDEGSSIILEKPELYFKGLFIGKAVALGLGGDLYVTDMKVTGSNSRNYTGLRRFDIALSAAYGYGNFAFGGSVYSGSSTSNPNIEIKKDSALADFAVKALFAEHTRLSNSEFVNIRFGMMYNISRLSFSAKSDRLLSYAGNQKELTFDDALDSVCLGMYYNRDRFRKRGRLNTWVFSAGAEVRNVFEDKEATLNTGAEIGLQLSVDYNVNLRFGYRSFLEHLDEGWTSFGLGARLEKFDIGLIYEKPIKHDDNTYRIGLDFAFMI